MEKNRSRYASVILIILTWHCTGLVHRGVCEGGCLAPLQSVSGSRSCPGSKCPVAISPLRTDCLQ